MIPFNSSGENKLAGCILSILVLQNVYLHPSFHSLKLINYLLVMEKAFWARSSFIWFTRMLLQCTSGFNHCAISSAAKFISNVKWHLLKNIYGRENDCIKAALFFHRFSLEAFWLRAAHFIDEIIQPAVRLAEAAVKLPALLWQTNNSFSESWANLPRLSCKQHQNYCKPALILLLCHFNRFWFIFTSQIYHQQGQLPLMLAAKFTPNYPMWSKSTHNFP